MKGDDDDSKEQCDLISTISSSIRGWLVFIMSLVYLSYAGMRRMLMRFKCVVDVCVGVVLLSL